MKTGRFTEAITVGCALIVAAGLWYAHPARVETAMEAVRAEIPKQDVLAAFRAEHAEVRQLESVQLSAVAEDEGAEDGVRDAARRELVALTGYMEAEETIEGVLRMRGYDDAVATVHADSVNVLVRTPSLSQNESGFILDLVMRETGQRGGNIKIMTVD